MACLDSLGYTLIKTSIAIFHKTKRLNYTEEPKLPLIGLLGVRDIKKVTSTFTSTTSLTSKLPTRLELTNPSDYPLVSLSILIPLLSFSCSLSASSYSSLFFSNTFRLHTLFLFHNSISINYKSSHSFIERCPW